MDYTDKTGEELLKKVSELQNENTVLRAQIKSSLSEDQLKLILESAGEGILGLDFDGNHTFVNPKAAYLLGYEPEDLIGRSSHSTWHYNLPDGSPFPREECPIFFTFKDGKTHQGESYFWRKDGSGFYVDYTSMPIFNNDSVIGAVVTFFDITGHKIAHEEILKLHRAVDSSGEAIFITDIDGLITYINPEFTNLYGYTADEVIGKTTPRILKSCVMAPENYKYFWDTLLNNDVVRGEFINKTKDGRLITIEGSANPILNDQKEIIGFIGIQHDITERKKTEEALRQSEERFRSVAQSANDAIITTDSKGNILGWNRGAEKTFGYKEPEIIGQSLQLIIPDNYLELHIKGMKRLETGGEKHVMGKTVELHGLQKNGKVFPLEISLSEWETSQGKFFTGIIRDITNRKRTESENQIIYEITQGVTTTSNLDELLKLIHQSISKVLYAENCFVALFNESTGLFSFPYFVDKFDTAPKPTSLGRSRTDYVFRTVKPLLLYPQLFDQLVEQNEVELVGSSSPSWIGVPLQTPSRTIGVLALQHYEKENVYSENDVKFLISIGSQIAISIERKRAEEEIKLKNELLQAINAEKDKFFSIIAHDLKGPLSAFIGATQILSEEIQNMTLEEIKEITVSMKESATNIYGLLENLLEWSRLKRGMMDFIPETFNVKQKIIASIEVLTESARKKEIKINYSLPEDLTIYADSHMFETVIRNLVTNAIKFTPKSGEISVSATATPDNIVEIKICDTGIGMNKELISKLFLLNEKTNRKGTEGEPSTGLGLLLCKEFIEKHNGKIRVESEEGKGSTFSLTIGQFENLKMN